MEINQYGIVLVELEAYKGAEMAYTRPCAVVSPNEMNRNLKTLVVAPMTTRARTYPTRVRVRHNKQTGWIAVDQITTLDDVDFSAQAVVRNLALPHDDPQSHPSHHRFVTRWAPIRKFYRDFRPWGIVDVEIDVGKRAGAENPIETRRFRLLEHARQI